MKKELKVSIFGGPIPQKIDPVTMIMPTGKGSLARSIASEMKKHFSSVSLIGNFDGECRYFFPDVEEEIKKLDANVVIFMPHLPNFFARYHSSCGPVHDKKIRVGASDEGIAALDLEAAPKLLPRIKKLHPEVLLVPFKIADPDMPLVEILRWMLDAHSALAVYSRLGDSQRYWILDVLGNEIACDKVDLPQKLAKEVMHFTEAVRRRSVRVGEDIPPVSDLKDFVSFSCLMQPAFSQIIEKNVGSGRWPGNFSFRCTHGFMSTRSGQGFVITKRDVEKTKLTENDFVYVDGKLHNEKLHFSGSAEAKPSIDAPVHRAIYAKLPWVKAIVHGHLFYDGSCACPGKLSRWPCGAENEADEIITKAPQESCDLWVANVEGHGFVALIGSEPISIGLRELSVSRYAMKH
jgi:hypothetical protein